jgi:pimeloyl-ACP methyl ester carboxylesterase
MTPGDGVGKQHLLDVGNGVQVNYFDTGGPGLPVVILHGLAGSATEFFATARALTGFRAILVELRGHGRSTTRPGDISREAFVADVVHVIETAVAAPVALVGQSMGGHTAMLVAAKRPDLVSRLVLRWGQRPCGEYAARGIFPLLARPVLQPPGLAGFPGTGAACRSMGR